jgi:predicted RNA-binding protein YlxR (DUF448 family)
MSKKGRVPVRTCIGCREKKKKEEMIWLAQSPGGVVVVNRKKPHQGRGFYLCPNLRCLNMAKKRRKGAGFLETMGFRFPPAEGFEEEARGLRYGR